MPSCERKVRKKREWVESFCNGDTLQYNSSCIYGASQIHILDLP